jgi:ankyrin repeat protein
MFRNDFVNAASKGNFTIVKNLLRAGENVNQTGNGLTTALMAAAEKGHLYIVAYLVQEARADIDKIDRENKTALDRAERLHDILKRLRIKKVKNAELELKLEDVIKYLNEVKKNPKYRIGLKFENVSRTNNQKRINARIRTLMPKAPQIQDELMLEPEPTISGKRQVELENLDKLLISGCVHMNLEQVTMALEQGADVNGENIGKKYNITYSSTITRFTPIYAHFDGLTYMPDNQTEGYLYRSKEIVKILCQNGVKLNDHYTAQMLTPLHMCCDNICYMFYKYSEPAEIISYANSVIEYLCEAGADINAVDKDGSTPLHAICKEDKDTRYEDVRVHMIKVLCKRGADPSIKDIYGQTPKDLAITNNDLALLKSLDECQKQDGGKKGTKRVVKRKRNRITKKLG